MTLFTMVSEKLHNNVYWSNRYILQGALRADVMGAAAAIRDAERDVHYTDVTFTKYRVSDQDPLTDNYGVIEDQVQGRWVIATDGADGQYLPLFNRARVLFTVAEGGRPSVKYLALPLRERDVTNGQLFQGTIDNILNNYVGALLDVNAYVDVDGQPFNGGAVQPKVAMRQLRRGSKRKLLPIIP